MTPQDRSRWEGEESVRRLSKILFSAPGDVVEVRALGVEGVGGKRVVSGYFDNPDDLIREVSKIDGKATGIFVTLNPVVPDLLARAHNRLKRSPKATTADTGIVRRRLLLIDVDPVRPSGISATDEEKKKAFDLLGEVFAFLKTLGFPAPAKADSGNGGHLVYWVDLPVDDDALVQRVLRAIAFRFDTKAVVIDQSVFNPARIVKLYGTMACKGDSTPNRPHRRSRLFQVPEPFEVVPTELLEKVAAMCPEEEKSQGRSAGGPRTDFDIERFIAQHHLEVSRHGDWNGGYRWVLGVCPFNSSHTDDAAFIVKAASGAVAAGCHHNGCLSKNWHDLRDLLEPDRQNRQNQPSGSSGTAVPGESEEWPRPQPLPDALPPVERFDTALLPESLRPWVEDIVERMQCPVEFVAAAVMVMLAAVLGKRVGIRPKRHDDWLVIANLWGIAIGRSSSMKSPSLREVFRPLKLLEKEARLEFEEAQSEFVASAMVGEAKRKLAKDDIRDAVRDGGDAHAIARELVDTDEREPTRRRLIVNDSTVEKLGMVLNENPNGLLVFRDELIGFLKSLDKDGQECSRAFYLEAWDGLGSFTYDRVGRGTLDIDAACVSVFGGIQPGPLAGYLRHAIHSGQGDDGLMQRFQLAVWPDVSNAWKNVDRPACAELRKAAFQVVCMLDQLEPAAVGAERSQGDALEHWFLHFSGEAQPVFDAWREQLELHLRSGEEHPAMESHLAKYRSLVPSLALLIHLADGGTGAVEVGSLSKAIGWAKVLESHARRIYSSFINSGVQAAGLILTKIRACKLTDGFSARDVYRSNWAGLSDKANVEEGLEVLCDLDWVAVRKEQTGGRSKTFYLINPKAMSDDHGTDDGAGSVRQEPGAAAPDEQSRSTQNATSCPKAADKGDGSDLSVLSVSGHPTPAAEPQIAPEATAKSDKRGDEGLLSPLAVPPGTDSQIEEAQRASTITASGEDSGPGDEGWEVVR